MHLLEFIQHTLYMPGPLCWFPSDPELCIWLQHVVGGQQFWWLCGFR